MTLPLCASLRMIGFGVAVATLFVAAPRAWAQYDFNLNEVCDLYVQNGRLALDVRLQPDPAAVPVGRGFGRMRFTVRDLRGDAEGSLRSGRLSIKCELLTGPERAPATLTLDGQSFGLTMILEVRGAKGSYTVTYRQLDVRDDGSEGGFVTLVVTDGSSKVINDFRAESFAVLCRDHPREATLYLGPIFRAMRLGSVFSVEPRFARLVLAEPLPADEAKLRFAAMLKQLDSDDPRQRSTASAEILRLGAPAIARLRELEVSLLSPQQQAEVEALLHHAYAPTEEQAKRLRDDVDFLADCLYASDEKVRAAALERLQTKRKSKIAINFLAEPSAITKAIEKLRDEVGKGR